jgi:hypothetical protein
MLKESMLEMLLYELLLELLSPSSLVRAALTELSCQSSSHSCECSSVSCQSCLHLSRNEGSLVQEEREERSEKRGKKGEERSLALSRQ